ncbi:hypothetical protein H4219_002349 [Mycoemilia scoparia]|uniref:Uncharacterized protein n=1 Tax=Mycoemilia scoparia TaxID=417184 RepID=A0A9W8A471_9FUNG|nr:hypothetical protein H4219_002349 [Mycoemilia scoparia]
MTGTVFSDKRSCKTILIGTGSAAATGATLGFSIAILKNLRPAGNRAFAMGLNWAICGFVFFTTRQTLLLEQKTKNIDYNLNDSQTRDVDELFSSTVAGVLTGSVIGGITRGRAGLFSGAVGLGATTFAGQYVYTKLYRRRQEIILSQNPPRTNDSDEVANLPQQKTPVNDQEEPKSLGGKLRTILTTDPLTYAPTWFPIRRIPRDEYRSMLEQQMCDVTQRLDSIEIAIQHVDKMEQVLKKSLSSLEAK